MRRNHANFSDFLDFAALEPLPVHGYRSSRNAGSEYLEWTGTPDFSAAMALARDGWEQGRAHIETYRAEFEAIIGDRIRRPVLTNDVAGFAPDVGAFLVGDPESMFARSVVETASPGRILHVVANCTASCGISAEQMIRRGAMICALIDALENAGYSCELTAAFCVASTTADDVRRSGKRLATADFIPVKAAGEPMELDRVAFMFAHPSALRRLAFSAWEQDAPFIMGPGGSFYGFPCEAPQGDRGDLYFSSVFLGDVSDADVVPWFKAQLAPLGITFDE